ncbi:metal ABC transporter ATP-binding protein [Mastigocoleus sp. MO_188.B34]|uniref:metal ABC transporter ATP-binding protein n=1 Tax=Mastigocoleus sp. MO_188.B34 TaxID=3036635 RepID=UPI00262FE7FB|nr:metal ABC transporter ATP-binding protein [Mastigocoleus sp. MO_188.B34]MDJ0694431.1 metal ABC transporter ATP-binding protein [Mastigocoleus sp. MO_188.B34]
MLEVEHLDVNYRGAIALENICFRALPGQMMGVIGPNGAGKSTLVKAILGLIPSARGLVTFRERSLKKQLNSVAYIPQRTQIDWDYPITVWNVVMMARTRHTGWFRKPSRQSKEIVKSALARVGMLDFCSRQIGELSGGQQQRVFLARALAQQADLFFFDEPFVGIDRKTEAIMFDVFRELKQDGKILILVTHDLGATLKKCDSLLLLKRQIIANGSFKEVITADNLQRAYGDNILLFEREEMAC